MNGSQETTYIAKELFILELTEEEKVKLIHLACYILKDGECDVCDKEMTDFARELRKLAFTNDN